MHSVHPHEKIIVKASSDSPDTLFVEFLNHLLSKADEKGYMFSQFRVKISKKGKAYNLSAEAWGEPLDQNVYEGAFWSAVRPLSANSEREDGMPQKFEDFTRGRWKDTPPLGIVA